MKNTSRKRINGNEKNKGHFEDNKGVCSRFNKEELSPPMEVHRGNIAGLNIFKGNQNWPLNLNVLG